MFREVDRNPSQGAKDQSTVTVFGALWLAPERQQ